MTVGINTEAVLPYIGNSTANVFPITFPTFEEETIEASVSDVDGIVTNLDIDTDFTLSSIGLPNTNGSMTLVNNAQAWLASGKLKTGYTLYIKFAASGLQPMRGREWGNFAPERFERTLDRFAMSILAVKAIAGQALGLSIGSGGNGTLPPLAGNDGRILQVNDTGDGFEYGVTSDTIEGYRDDANASAVAADASEVAADASADAAAVSATAAAASATQANTSSSNAATARNAAETAADNAAASESNAAGSSITANTAKNAAVIAQGLAEAARDAAIAAAADTSAAEGFKDDAEAARDAAVIAQAAAEAAQAIAETAEAQSEAAATGSEAAMVGAEAAMGFAQAFADDAEESAQQSELFAGLNLYQHKLNISFADSPFTVDDDSHDSTLIIVDDTGGDVVINMPAISDTSDQLAWKVGFVKQAATGNKFTVNRNGTDTIAGTTSIDVEDPGLGVLLYANSPTDWAARYFLSVVAQDAFILGGGALNFGDPGVNGTWRIIQDGTVLKFEQRQLGVWVEADAMNPPS